MKRLFLGMALGIMQRIAPDLFVRNAVPTGLGCGCRESGLSADFHPHGLGGTVEVNRLGIQATPDPDGTILLKDMGWRGRLSLVG